MKGLTITNGILEIKKNKDLLLARLERLFFCELNSTIGFLERGSRIPEIIHSFNNNEIPKEISSEVGLLISIYEPEITLLSVTTTLTDTINGTCDIEISIEFTWNSTNELDSLSIKKSNAKGV